MKIPTRITIGRKKHAVKVGKFKPDWKKGHWQYPPGLIRIQSGYTAKQRAESFWHEVTHAILHDMRHSLWSDEKFVTAFSKRLNSAIHSAEFDGAFDVEKWKRENL